LFIVSNIVAQDPYIMDGTSDGLGKYGYLEYDAVTYSHLNRNTHGNVRHLGARWWVDGGSGGSEYVYWTTPNDNNWQCNSDNGAYKSTNDYNPGDFGGEWQIGADCYVSVYAEYCDGTKNPNGGSGTGYNEKQFQVIDVDNSPYSGVVNQVPDGDGNCSSDQLVAAFTIDPGSLSSLSLKRFWFKNIGTAQEGTDIPNDGFTVFYEPYTGSETFDGTESNFKVYGDYNSNSTTNNEYGNDAVTASLNGKTRFYVLLCDINNSSNGTTVDLVILNDGISIDPGLNGKNLLRVNEANITNNSIGLPINMEKFKGYADKDANILNWSTLTESNTSMFYVERSESGKEWTSIAKVEAAGDSYMKKDYQAIDRKPLSKAFYRLRMTDKDGRYSMSKVISIERKEAGLKLNAVFPNPNDGNFVVNLTSLPDSDGQMVLVNALGVKVYTKSLSKKGGTYIEKINVNHLPDGIYTLLIEQNNTVITKRVAISK
ncbi:MAG TPA: T9SS type A sorting domain-containing protein, partial [Bacteroidetes bacterium]|nr:T9SS type A sorting domain-containing protein [Bacteroidota bacterium]